MKDNTNEEIMESQNQLQQPQQRSEGTTFLRTCFNGLNVVSGVGILSIPYALSQGGWLSLIILFLVAVLCWYTGLLLRRCMDANPLIKTYPDIGDLAFGCKGRAMVSILMYLELYFVAVEFLILEGDNLEKLFPNFGFIISGLKIGGKQGFVLLTALIIWPTTWLRSLGILAYVSAGGVLASITLVACVLWVGAVDGVGFHERGKLLNWGGLPTAVLAACFIISTANYGSMAILGYLMYGDHLKSQVTLNLPIRKISSKLAIYTTLINPLTKYAVIITPIATALEDTPHLRKSRPISILVRTVLVISTVIVAITIPFFGYVLAFTGSFLGVTVSILLPCLCYLRINKTARRFGLELMLIVGILLIGALAAVVGTYTSLKQIVTHL
ncbi:Aa trans domain-containing protein [Citrus sinensis]|uniref:Aa trans domain-containing protein n=1 Tax=Citrus sinensis TaxID=2711 RepID=A0ACB8LKF3_CITSI|nr:Aa trans domain-containing protein [Citrus sinensis]